MEAKITDLNEKLVNIGLEQEKLKALARQFESGQSHELRELNQQLEEKRFDLHHLQQKIASEEWTVEERENLKAELKQLQEEKQNLQNDYNNLLTKMEFGLKV